MKQIEGEELEKEDKRVQEKSMIFLLIFMSSEMETKRRLSPSDFIKLFSCINPDTVYLDWMHVFTW